MEPFSSELLPLVVAGFIIALLLALASGANDIANSFGTSVGSGALTLNKAFILATIFELAGVSLVGYKVSDTMRKGIIDVNMYNNTEKELMYGSLAALAASWILSPLLSGAVSAFVYALIYFAILRRKHSLKAVLLLDRVPWWGSLLAAVIIGAIVAAIVRLFVVPKLRKKTDHSGSFSRKICELISKQKALCENSPSPEKDIAPVVRFSGDSGVTSISDKHLVNGTNATHNNHHDHHQHHLSHPLSDQNHSDPKETESKSPMSSQNGCKCNESVCSGSTTNDTTQLNKSSVACGCVVIDCAGVPSDPGNSTSTEVHAPRQSRPSLGLQLSEEDSNPADPIFSFLQILTACFGSFAHGGNDVSNTIGPLVALWLIYTEGNVAQKAETPVYILLYGGVGMVIGLWIWGRRLSEEDSNPADPIFSFLQILTACFGSFAHGGNDVSNTIGPLVALWLIYTEGNVAQKAETPVYILLYGGVGMVIGLWIWGRRVIETIGTDLTHITPHSGFTIEIGSAMTVLLASKIGLPISTTHCKVGSVVIVGSIVHKFQQGVQWSIFRNILLAWIVTVPVAGGISSLLMWLFLSFGL
ncbi:unnamed protein product [Notodromas monacha]|uniref:Phosphate transporter n=1 Tax=Notodromas monacha TaxID=399045 RepID=A0A7R9BSF7_9CRUS|nr:unnamed protein product [Notodromas monacha]CAG0920858.1 unnamed protein product [Notodromas monacha]